jgi:type VI secretion system protein ImpA
MPAPSALDVEVLLTPVATDKPSGESVRYAGPYDTIQQARWEEDDLDQGGWVRQTKAADWATVIKVATDTLTTRSKDLQIAVWLVEALVKQHGFVGLRDGLRLLWELQERFWEHLYPEIDEDDLGFRAAPLEWLNDKLPLMVKQVVLTQGTNGERYTWLRWEESRQMDNLGRRDQQAMQMALADGKITGEQFDKAVEATSVSYYQILFEVLTQSYEEYQKLDQVTEEKFGPDAPSLTSLKQAIEACHTLVKDILSKRGALVTPPEGPEVTAGDAEEMLGSLTEVLESTAGLSGPASAVGSRNMATGLTLEPQDRADALRRLAAIATFFRRTEPHSPVSYLVQRAVRWAEMPLEAWLPYVIHDDTVLDRVRETLGLKDNDIGGTGDS